MIRYNLNGKICHEGLNAFVGIPQCLLCDTEKTHVRTVGVAGEIILLFVDTVPSLRSRASFTNSVTRKTLGAKYFQTRPQLSVHEFTVLRLFGREPFEIVDGQPGGRGHNHILVHLWSQSCLLVVCRRPAAFGASVKGDTVTKKSAKGKSKVHKVMKEHKQGKLKSGSGKKVKSRKQAVAIALSEARKSGAKIPKKKRSS